MANKEKKIQEQSNQTTDIQTNETKAKKSARTKWAFRLIVVSAVGLLAYGIYYNLKAHQDNLRAKTNRSQTTFVAPRPTKVIPIKPDIIDTESKTPTAKPSKTTADTDNMANVPAGVQADITASPNEHSVAETDTAQELPSETTAPIILPPQDHADIVVPPLNETFQSKMDIEINAVPNVQETERIFFDAKTKLNAQNADAPHAASSKIHFTVADALELRDNFLSGEPCSDNLRKLIMSDNQSKAAQDAIKDISYFCFATTNVRNELKNLFLKSKKEALIRYYKENDARWKYRLKKVFVSLVKVRNLNPMGDTVPNLLDKAHNAFIAKNMTLTLETLSKLPDNIRPMFTEFTQKTNNFVEAKTALDALILSYAKGE